MTLTDEDAKLLILARGAAGRTGGGQGAAVRDTDGRTYAGAPVDRAHLTLTALQVAAATALASGAPGFEAGLLFGGSVDDAGIALLHEISPAAVVIITDLSGHVKEN